MSDRDRALAPLFGHPTDDLVRHVPHSAELRMHVESIERDEAILSLPYREALVADPERGVVFGGVITTLVDQSCGLAVFARLPTFETIATIDLRIDYLRPATPGRDLYCTAHCYRLARRVAFARAVAYEDDPSEPFATTVATFMRSGAKDDTPLKRLVAKHAARAQAQQ